MKKKFSPLWVLAICLLLSSCGSTGGKAQGQASTQPDYKSVKAMVLDILQTDDAKKSVAKMMKDEKFRQAMVLDQSTIRSTVVQSIASPNSPHIKQVFKDPAFTSTLAKSMRDENRTLMKDLMKDPEYQKSMMSIMKTPEFETQMLTLMQSPSYRQRTMQIMKEAMQSPLFQMEMVKIVTKVAEEMQKPEIQAQSKQKGKGKKGQGKGGKGGKSGGGRGGAGGKT